MKHVLSTSMVLNCLALLMLPAAELNAQSFGGAPGEDTFSVGALFGHFDPQTTYRDGGRFDSSTLFGVTGTWWAHRYAGLNGSIAWTRTEGVAPGGGPSIVSGRDPRQILFDLDVLLRYPIGAGQSLSVSPYLAGGPGWKRYRVSQATTVHETSFGWSYAAGAEVRFGSRGRFGLRGELREFRSNFELWGEDVTQRDRSFSTAVLVNF